MATALGGRVPARQRKPRRVVQDGKVIFDDQPTFDYCRKLVKHYRQRRQLTCQQVADRIGVSKAAVNQFELGYYWPDLSVLLHLATELGIPYRALLAPPVPETLSELIDLLTQAPPEVIPAFCLMARGLVNSQSHAQTPPSGPYQNGV